jgi:NTP pyrophosphatase (non-canonical NTP hydrolase)
MELDTINKLYLELSQVATAKTKRELELEELLRSACAIAERKGEGTHWDRFIKSVNKAGLNGTTARVYRVLEGECPTIGEALEARPEPSGTEEEMALIAVLAERSRQNKKWGEQNHDPFTYLTILVEEVGEYAEAALHARFGGPKAEGLYAEATHVAAVGLAIVECLERAKWGWPPSQDDNAARVADLRHEIASALEFGEGQLASEKLGGNVVKEEYWKGELHALHRMRQALETSHRQKHHESVDDALRGH